MRYNFLGYTREQITQIYQENNKESEPTQSALTLFLSELPVFTPNPSPND